MKNLFNAFSYGYKKDFELYFKLKAIDKDVLTNSTTSTTILIDGVDFQNNEDKFNWDHFIAQFNGETNFYELSLPNLIQGLNIKYPYDNIKKIKTLQYITKTCGKLLGYIIYSEKFFRNSQINLV